MMADPKRKSHQDAGDSDKRSRQEDALDEALKNHLSGVRSGFSGAADDERARLSFLTLLIRMARIILERHTDYLIWQQMG